MNYNCLSDCKFKAVCNLNAEQTARCKVASDPWAKKDEREIFGRTSKEICRKQGREGDLK